MNFRHVQSDDPLTLVILDVDGQGPKPPGQVLCGVSSTGSVITAVKHDMEEKTKVDGFQAPGSFSQSIHYQVIFSVATNKK